jgi:hypothetical protein
MSDLRLAGFKPEHARGIVGMGPNGPVIGGDLEERIIRASKAGHFISALAPEGLVCIAGVTIRWRGVAEATAFTTDLTAKYPIAVVKACRAGLKSLAQEFGLWRLDAHVVADWKAGNRFVKALGFEKEGLLKKFGPEKQDCYLYARLF